MRMEYLNQIRCEFNKESCKDTQILSLNIHLWSCKISIEILTISFSFEKVVFHTYFFLGCLCIELYIITWINGESSNTTPSAVKSSFRKQRVKKPHVNWWNIINYVYSVGSFSRTILTFMYLNWRSSFNVQTDNCSGVGRRVRFQGSPKRTYFHLAPLHGYQNALHSFRKYFPRADGTSSKINPRVNLPNAPTPLRSQQTTKCSGVVVRNVLGRGSTLLLLVVGFNLFRLGLSLKSEGVWGVTCPLKG